MPFLLHCYNWIQSTSEYKDHNILPIKFVRNVSIPNIFHFPYLLLVFSMNWIFELIKFPNIDMTFIPFILLTFALLIFQWYIEHPGPEITLTYLWFKSTWKCPCASCHSSKYSTLSLNYFIDRFASTGAGFWLISKTFPEIILLRILILIH